MSCHIAVVPVREFDMQARRALRYACTLTPEVLAVHVRDGNVVELEDAWSSDASTVPLVIVDVPNDDWRQAFLRTVQTLRRSEQADYVTVVVPNDELRLGLERTPGVVVTSVPRSG